MKKWIAILALVVLVASISTAALAQDASKPPSGQNDAVDMADVENSAFLSLDLAAGFPLDPFFVSVNGGGDLDASTLSEECTGYINESPIVSLNWSGTAKEAHLFFYSDQDPTLVVQMPDGSYLCNDDAHEGLLDPTISMKNPPAGQYNIWVGSYDEGQLLPGVLVITTKSDYQVGNFSLNGFVRRGQIANRQTEVETYLPEAGKLRAAVTSALEKAVKSAPVLDAKSQVLTKTLTAAGENPAFLLPASDNSPSATCTGLVGQEAGALVNLTSKASSLAIFFEGNADSSLVVIAPDGDLYCVDDSADGSNRNPMLTLENPTQGVYAVLVGRFDPANPVTGTLTVDISGKLEPAVLEPEGTLP